MAPRTAVGDGAEGPRIHFQRVQTQVWRHEEVELGEGRDAEIAEEHGAGNLRPPFTGKDGRLQSDGKRLGLRRSGRPAGISLRAFGEGAGSAGGICLEQEPCAAREPQHRGKRESLAHVRLEAQPRRGEALAHGAGAPFHKPSEQRQQNGQRGPVQPARAEGHRRVSDHLGEGQVAGPCPPRGQPSEEEHGRGGPGPQPFPAEQHRHGHRNRGAKPQNPNGLHADRRMHREIRGNPAIDPLQHRGGAERRDDQRSRGKPQRDHAAHHPAGVVAPSLQGER